MFAVELACAQCGSADLEAGCARARELTGQDDVEPRYFVTRWEAHVAGQQAILSGSTHAHTWRYAVVEVAAFETVR